MLVSLAAVFSIVTQRSSPLRDDTKNGCRETSTMQNYIYFNPKKDPQNLEQYWQESKHASNCKNLGSTSKRALF